MKPAVVVLALCLVASVLLGIHQMVCDQDTSKTTRCDLWFGIPVMVLMAVACGLAGLALISMSDKNF
jgi:hypothetical protein